MSNYHPVSMQPQVLDLSKNTDLGTGEWGLKNFLEEKSIFQEKFEISLVSLIKSTCGIETVTRTLPDDHLNL